MPWRPREPGEIPTLGFDVLDWITEHLAAPDKSEFEPFAPTLEQAQFIINFYALDTVTGRRRYRRGVISRPKGWGKSPFLAAIACAEALAPVVPDGWDADGRPVGKPWSTIRNPWVQLLAVAEDQTRNAWAPLLEMLREGSACEAYPGLEPMETFVALPGKGRIEFSTSASTSKEGNRPTFAVLDQALALDTPIPTPTGWTTMGEIQVGDLLLGRSGTPTRVIKTTRPSAEHRCFRVTFADGASMIASEGHRWLTRVAGSAAKSRVRTTGDMVADGRRFRVPVAAAWDLPKADLSVPPYLLGQWLGNGGRGRCDLTIGDQDLAETRVLLKARGAETTAKHYGTRAATVSFSSHAGFQGANRPQIAKTMAALPCYRDKHVPAQYLRASIEQRTELLRGLMDSDGHVSTTGYCTFSSVTPALIDGVAELLRSLGQVANIVWRDDPRYTSGRIGRVHFMPRAGLVPFALARKVARLRPAHSFLDWLSITSIEPVESVEVRCVGVAAEDHLFLAGVGCHVTHNTEEWKVGNGGRRLAETVRRNLGKTGGSSIESPNAYVPGEESVAEMSANYWANIREGRTRDSGLLYDHREWPPETDMSDRDSLHTGLAHVYGESADVNGGWVDLDRLIAEIWDPSTEPQNARRYYGNAITHAVDSWVSQPQWAACSDPTKVVADKDVIALGFDGSRHRTDAVTDATGLVGVRISDGHMFVLGCWEQPDHVKDWWAPTLEVDQVVREAFERYNVVAFYADPAADWRSFVANWERDFGDRLKVKSTRDHPVEWWMGGQNLTKTVRATDQLYSAIAHKELTHDASSALTRHVLNARRRSTRVGVSIAKDFPESPRKIDLAVAGILAWQARLDAVATGALAAVSHPRSKRLVRF